jgi:uncharacterized membrane protein YhhN
VPGTLLTDPYARLIGLGLLFSLLGDIWLMLPKDRFLYGLVSFPLAHVCYCFAFLTSVPAHGFPWLVLSLSIIGALVLAYPWPTLPARLNGAVSLYAAIIVTMATLSADQAAAHPSTGMLSAAIGALLFRHPMLC